MMQSRRNAMHVPDRPGIYKLYTRKAGGDLKLVYIGRATSLRKRLTSHNKPLWDECTFEVVTDEAIRKLMEKHLISEFTPPYNKLEYGDPFDTGREESALWTFLEEDRFMSLNELAGELGEAPVAMEEPLERLCDQGLVETKTASGLTMYNVSGAIALEEDVANVVDDSRFNTAEQEILSVFVKHDDFLSYEDLAEELGRPDEIKAIRSRVSDLSKKVNFEKERDGKYVRYKLVEKVKKQVEAVQHGSEIKRQEVK